jgi:hypothetical protein
VSQWWSRKAVSETVRKGVDGAYQMPYQAQGFSCIPVVQGKTTQFTCKLKGADVPPIVTLRFNVDYRSAAGNR